MIYFSKGKGNNFAVISLLGLMRTADQVLQGPYSCESAEDYKYYARDKSCCYEGMWQTKDSDTEN